MTEAPETEINSAIRNAAKPFVHPLGGADNAIVLALPPGWERTEIIPAVNPETRPLYHADCVSVRTAAGFAAELTRIAGEHPIAVAQTANALSLAGTVNPGVFGEPDFRTTVILAPEPSRERQILQGMRNLSLEEWEKALDEIAYFVGDSGPSYADLVADVRSWSTESRREYSRIKKDEAAETHEKQEAVTRLKSKAIKSFTVTIPLFEFDEPADLVVVIDRDVEAATLSARVPGIDLVLRQRRTQIFEEAAALGNWDIIR